MTDVIEQRSPEWRALRCGKVTASRVADVVAKTRTGWGASRANYMAELIAERLTGLQADGYVSGAMKWGIEHEAAARAAYEFHADATIANIAFVQHPAMPESGASPDGLIGDTGLVEIKCPLTATHMETLLGSGVERKYLFQMQWQMACTGRLWCDFVSFDPRLPEIYRLHIRRIVRDDELIASLTRDIKDFLQEIAEKERLLRAKFERGGVTS